MSELEILRQLHRLEEEHINSLSRGVPETCLSVEDEIRLEAITRLRLELISLRGWEKPLCHSHLDDVPMSLETAIEHAREVASSVECKECARDHEQLAEWLEALLEESKDGPSTTEAWIINWKRKTGPVLAKSSTSGIADVDLFLTKEEANNWCEVLKAQDAIHAPNQDLRGTREVRKVLVTFTEKEEKER